MHAILPLIFYAIKDYSELVWFQKPKRSSIITAKDLTNILDKVTVRHYAEYSLQINT